MAESTPKLAIGDVQRSIESTPTEGIAPPQPSGAFIVDDVVYKSFPTPGTKILRAQNYGQSLWGKTAKIEVELPSGAQQTYFLKLDETGSNMCKGEFEALKAIHEISPAFVPQSHTYGRYVQDGTDKELYFLLMEFRDVGEQPAEPLKLASSLADLHLRSVSPTGKFGFHIATNHGKIIQDVGSWEESWCTLYSKHLGHFMTLAKPILNWSEFDVMCDLLLEKVVPRLLLPLQTEGRTLKPCLVHGDCWDGNTAMDEWTGEAFVFDVCSLDGHSEYDTGNWRAPRHRLSHEDYIRNYKLRYAPSEPVEDWDARNLLYSLTFNIGNTIQIAGSTQRLVVYEDMITLCKMFCLEDLKKRLQALNTERLVVHGKMMWRRSRRQQVLKRRRKRRRRNRKIWIGNRAKETCWRLGLHFLYSLSSPVYS